MSGGTLTPPRHPTWDNEELVAPVIPFRQRGEQPQQQISVDRTSEAPIVVAPPDEPPAGWIHQGNDLLARDDASGAPRSLRVHRLLIAGFIAAALAVGAVAALALSHDPQPHARLSAEHHTRLSTRTRDVSSSRDDRRAKTAVHKPARHTTTTHHKHTTTTTAGLRARKAKHSPTAAASAVAATSSLSPDSTPTPASNPCAQAVPGQLGC